MRNETHQRSYPNISSSNNVRRILGHLIISSILDIKSDIPLMTLEFVNKIKDEHFTLMEDQYKNLTDLVGNIQVNGVIKLLCNIGKITQYINIYIISTVVSMP